MAVAGHEDRLGGEVPGDDPAGREAAGVGLEILVLDTDGRITTDYQFIES